MERNDVIKALEWCSELRLCVDCPMRAEGYFSHSVNDCKKALAEKAIALIRELTEENEAQDKAIINALKQIAKVREETKAETVQKYGKAVYQFIFGFIADKIGEQDKDYIVVRLAQIAQELLKGDEE